MTRRHFLIGTVGLFGSACLVGCGGGSSSFESGMGRATFIVKWPERSRFIPEMANALVVQILDGLTVLDSITLTRPSGGGSLVTSATFSNLPIGLFDIYIQAFPNADETGVAQAAAIEAITITSSGNATVTATLFTLIASIELIAAGNATRVGVGSTLQLTATPKNHDGEIVITTALNWVSSDTAKATVSSMGIVTRIAGGSVMITVDDGETQISTSVTLSS